MAFYVSKTPKPTLKNISKEQLALLKKFEEYTRQEMLYMEFFFNMLFWAVFVIWIFIAFVIIIADNLNYLIVSIFIVASLCLILILVIRFFAFRIIQKSIFVDYATHKMAMQPSEFKDLLKELENN